MSDTPDAELLQQFARSQSEAAFAELVERHIGLVYSTALRKTDNPQHAQDVTQAVFIILVRKAGSLGPKTVLPGWLYHTARLTAANLQRAELRRIRREQEAFMQSTMDESAPDALWRELSPLLEDGMAGLGATDRDAIVLRFFQNRSLAEVGVALGASEDAARMRVNRALESLRKFFNKRGVVSTTAIIAGVISSNSVQAAPAGLAQTTSAVALAKGAAASASTLTLAKGALKIMAWTKTQTAIVAGAGILLAAGTATIAVKEATMHRGEIWQRSYDTSWVDRLPPQARILPSLPSTVRSRMEVWGDDGRGPLGLGQTVSDLLMMAYGVSPAQLILNTPLPDGKYDFIDNLPTAQQESKAMVDSKDLHEFKAMQEEIQKRFGLTGRPEMIETNVLILTVQSSNAPDLHPTAATDPTTYYHAGPGFYSVHGMSIQDLVFYLEQNLGVPVVNRSGFITSLDIDFQWPGKTPDDLKRAVLNQAGLKLTPSVQNVKFVVVEKAK